MNVESLAPLARQIHARIGMVGGKHRLEQLLNLQLLATNRVAAQAQPTKEKNQTNQI